MKRRKIKSVLILGSGPIVIGQAAEFDYSGTQGCMALREEGIRTILLNSNPATIMTDPQVADAVYIEPMTVDACEAIIEKERPDGVIATLGGQTALNLGRELSIRGILEKYGSSLLGTGLDAIETAEDRDRFRSLMKKIGEPVPKSEITHTVAEAVSAGHSIGFPVIVRPAYTLGGSGGGIASGPAELEAIAYQGLKASPITQVMVEQNLYGWKEIEYEVVRDGEGTAIIVCNMENIDSVGVHTGDSVVVAPSQTLSDRQYQMLRDASLKIIGALDIRGGCNIQFALHPSTDSYFIIEVNPRVSRSSALASKATGYPIAKIAAKIAVGFRLDEIRNPITGKSACFEPALDYLAVKFPKWPFEKFTEADGVLGTQMQATGEVMSIATSFEAAFMKGFDSTESRQPLSSAEHPWGFGSTMEESLSVPTAGRFSWIFKALASGVSADTVARLSSITPWFIKRLEGITTVIRELEAAGSAILETKNAALLSKAKRNGVSDSRIAKASGISEGAIRNHRTGTGLVPVFKMIDTCAGEFESSTPYFYSAWETEDEPHGLAGKSVVILGSGPIRIGQGIEFDWGCVHAAWALKKLGIRAIMVNNNPETVSTDFSTADVLYFESLTFESVMDIIEREKPLGVIAQLGGQTALNLVGQLADAGVTILGTSRDALESAEDRGRFDAIMAELGVSRPEGRIVASVGEAMVAAEALGFPLLVRPSFVIGGLAMTIIHDRENLKACVEAARDATGNAPLLVDRYLEGKEIEIDGVCDGKNLMIAGIMEHVERSGIHSGDSMAYFPPRTLTAELKERVFALSKSIAQRLKVKGLINIQFVVSGDVLHVIEVNPRASRTLPILSKMTGTAIVDEAVRVMLSGLGGLPVHAVADGIIEEPPFSTVKAPVFSTHKLKGASTVLGPQMKSTGEVLGIGKTHADALAKAFIASGFGPPSFGFGSEGRIALVSLSDKREAADVSRACLAAGFIVTASSGTADSLSGSGIPVERLGADPLARIEDLFAERKIGIAVNTSEQRFAGRTFGKRLRTLCSTHNVPCFTCVDTAMAYFESLEALEKPLALAYDSIEALSGGKTGGSGATTGKNMTEEQSYEWILVARPYARRPR